MTAKAKQERLWNRFLSVAKNCELVVSANALRASMGAAALQFGEQNGIQIHFDPQVTLRYSEDRKYQARLRKLIYGVETNKLGLRFREEDFDILAPNTWNEDQVAEYSQLGWILIATGIVIVTAVIGHSLWLYKREQEIRQKYNELLATADSKFCKDPNSPLCGTWLEKKKTENFEPKKSTIEILEAGIKTITSSTGSALKWGLAIAIPLLAWSYLGKKR